MRYLAAPTSVHNNDISRRKPHTTPGHAFNIRVIVVPAPRRVVIVLDFNTSNMPEMLGSTSYSPPGATATSASRALPWASELSLFWAQAGSPDTSTASSRPSFLPAQRDTVGIHRTSRCFLPTAPVDPVKEAPGIRDCRGCGRGKPCGRRRAWTCHRKAEA